MNESLKDLENVGGFLKLVVKPSPILLNITNKMQRYTIFFIAVNALHVSGGFPAHHQELINCTQWVIWQCQLTHASGSSKQA
jgi:hypothetical protein